MGLRVKIEAGQFYYNEDKTAYRRVLDVIARPADGEWIVFYSKGGDRNYTCTRDTFLAWRGDKPKRKQKDAESGKD